VTESTTQLVEGGAVVEAMPNATGITGSVEHSSAFTRIDEIRTRLKELAVIENRCQQSRHRFRARDWQAVLEARAARKKLNGELPAPAARKSATGGRHSAPSAS
jgi:hypothetical protein